MVPGDLQDESLDLFLTGNAGPIGRAEHKGRAVVIELANDETSSGIVAIFVAVWMRGCSSKFIV